MDSGSALRLAVLGPLPLFTDGAIYNLIFCPSVKKINVTWEFREKELCADWDRTMGPLLITFQTLTGSPGTFYSCLKSTYTHDMVLRFHSDGRCLRASTDAVRQTIFQLGLAPVRISP